MRRLKSKFRQLKTNDSPASSSKESGKEEEVDSEQSMSFNKSKVNEKQEMEPNEKIQEPTPEEIERYHMKVLEEGNKNLIWSIIKGLRFGTEVKHIRLPLFLLKPTSLLEYFAHMFQRPDILGEGAIDPNPEQRFLSVLRYYMALWCVAPTWKKPFNPVVGEHFRCQIVDERCDGFYVAEQLSHHPMKTGVFYCDKRNGVVANGFIHPKYFRFWGNSTESKLKGMLKVTFIGNNYEEDYVMNFPTFGVRGILLGTLMTDLWGSVVIRCEQTGYVAEIDFKTKGWLRGNYHEVEGKVKKGGYTLYKMEGLYDHELQLTKLETMETVPLLNLDKYRIVQKTVPPLPDQAPNESRRFWSKVVNGIIRDNYDEAYVEKDKIEDKQRADEKRRKETGTKHVPTYFKQSDIKGKEFWMYAKYGEVINDIRLRKRAATQQ